LPHCAAESPDEEREVVGERQLLEGRRGGWRGDGVPTTAYREKQMLKSKLLTTGVLQVLLQLEEVCATLPANNLTIIYITAGHHQQA